MVALGFRIEYRGEAPNQVAVKVRDSGAYGRCIGDEAALWDALQDSIQENRELASQYDALMADRQRLGAEHQQLLEEHASLRAQHERKGKR